MERLRAEHVYTSTGRQRPVFLRGEGGVARFAVETRPGDEVRVEVSHDPEETVRKGKALWQPYEAEGGGVFCATALRVVVLKLDGWVSLIVEESMNG